MELTRNRHFKEWIEKIYVGCVAMYKAIPENEAKIRFQDEYMEDANMLIFVLNSTFPNTKRVGDEYHFVTKEEFTHTVLRTDPEETYKPGAMTLRIDSNFMPVMGFENKLFKHGQIREDGSVKCWGGFTPFPNAFCDIGLSGALMDAYNFARVSDHDTRMKEHA